MYNTGFYGLSRENYIRSLIAIESDNETFRELTEEDKKDIVVVNGRRYVRKIAEMRGIVE